MDPSKKATQTNIIDDLEAISLAQQGQRRGLHPKKKPEKQAGFSFARPQNATTGVSIQRQPVKKVATQSNGTRHYERDGLKTSLYNRGNNKRPYARLSRSLRNKNVDFLLDVVEEYAGAAKRAEFTAARTSKADLSDWIEAKETVIYGPHPQSQLAGKSASSGISVSMP
jgi:ribosome-binding protein aMBF1 (putative translation factor)